MRTNGPIPCPWQLSTAVVYCELGQREYLLIGVNGRRSVRNEGFRYHTFGRRTQCTWGGSSTVVSLCSVACDAVPGAVLWHRTDIRHTQCLRRHRNSEIELPKGKPEVLEQGRRTRTGYLGRSLWSDC